MPGNRDQNGLRGRTVVVTGAARGLGAALAVSLARRGARVAAVGLEPGRLADTVTRCGPGAAARAWTADVTDAPRMQAVAAEVAEHFGRVDVVVANAGIGLGGPLLDCDPGAYDRVIQVNLLGSVTTARAFLPGLLAARGYYLQVASLAALAPAPLMSAYAAAKAGAEAFALALRGEVAHQGVAVGVAYLSWTDTDLVRAVDEDDVLARIRAGLPGPARRTAPLDPAVRRIVAGISRRAPRVYGQPWVAAAAWLPRALLPELTARQGTRAVARLEADLRATAGQRRQPLGPGGRAAMPD